MKFSLRKFYYLTGFFILIAILIRIDLQKIMLYFSKLDLFNLFLINLIIIPMLLIKSFRWFYLLRLQGVGYSVANSVMAYLGGVFAGIITPGRFGEAMKAVYLKMDKKLPLCEGMASVIIDRLLDLYLLLFFAAIGLWNFLKFRYYKFNTLLFIFISAVLFIIPFVFLHKPFLEKAARSIYKSAIAKIDSSFFDSQFKSFFLAVKKIATPRIYPALIFTLISYVFYFLECYLLARLMLIDISFMTVVFFVSISTLFSLLPISIWGFGTRESALLYCFSLLGLGAERAMAYSFLLFSAFYLCSGIVSFAGWLLKGCYGLRISDQQG